ncbi:MAG: hypothetical protein LAN62_08635 [Acidobacteriia bacterium]|nr:hypothetical protein [Terriglobia bacterium]
MRILTLLLRHGTAKYENAIDDIEAFFARQLPSVEWDLLVIDNTLPEGYEEVLPHKHVLIGGSNAQWEFSAWDNGIAHIGRRLAEYDLIHLATSAFATLYTRYLDRIGSEILQLILRRGAAVGHIDYYNEPIVIFGRQSQAWLRSSFVFLPPAELKMLGSLVSVADQAGLFTGNPTAPFRDDAPMSENYRQYILGWLTGDGTGQGVQWHSRFALSQDTLPWFQSKVLTILNEHMLSIRLRAQGCAMVDATWLATRAKTLPPAGQPLGPIPSWRKQITERDTDPAPSKVLFRSMFSLRE